MVEILHLVQQTNNPLTHAQLQATQIHGLAVDCVWASRALYAFLYEHVVPNMKRTMQLRVGAGQEYNGLELWRVPFFENEGGAAEVEVLERDCFVAFPECPGPKYSLE